ncbi:MAG: PHA/PHB synthase family protein [Burkholderiaceae bacterium]
MRSDNNYFDFVDKKFQANLGRLTAGVSPAALMTSCYSWLTQLAQSPGRVLELALYPAVHFRDCANKNCGNSQPGDEADPRFKAERWQHFPWHLWAENFCLTENWWQRATTELPGLPKHVERTMSFLARQMLDALSPANFVATNPELFQETIDSSGRNLVHAAKSALADAQQRISGAPAPGLENFVVGDNLAITPGRVVFRNHLIELIQYTPQSETVYKTPVLMIPAWIMKYYILDLSPDNSLVNWLVRQGHTVFMVSWRNPDATDRDLGLDDYYRQGAMAAIDFISALMPKPGIHLMGYCLGGTLAIITAAAMANNGDERLRSLTLLAAQADFTDAGELMLFVTESEVAFLKNMMWDKGYLEGEQMAGTFQMLHSSELIWSRMIHDLMMDKRRDAIDLLAWNADATRMPYKMHSEYLEKLFLHNDFVEGRFSVEGEGVAPASIRLPIFAVSTEEDHVAPWRSVHKIHLIVPCEDITFVLTSGGHNAGIVSEPGHRGRFYHIHTTTAGEPYRAPDRWLEGAQGREGSWWLAWHDWLVQKVDQEKTAPPILNEGLCPAPGSYVLQK